MKEREVKDVPIAGNQSSSHVTEFNACFEIQNGVKQGCILSPTLFSMFINDLVEDINTAGLGVHCKENIISSLLFTMT